MPKINPCPYHGTKYLVKEGNVTYCGFLTPKERFSKCFHHPNVHNKENNQSLSEELEEKPNVIEALESHWSMKKRNRKEARERAKVYNVRARVQS